MGLKKPIVSEIARDTFAINEFGMSTMYVVKGAERALLIDTACGLCDIKALVASLVGELPYEVVLTHGHGDHVGGCTAFSSVWLHEADFPMLKEFDRERLSGYIAGMSAADKEQVYDVPKEYRFQKGTVPELKPLQEGQSFELGGRQLRVIHTPGHTPGSCCLIDSASRILFSGDACNFNLGIMGSGIRTALAGLQKLKDNQAEFDQNFNGHVGHIFGGEPDCRAMKESILDECIGACQGILDGSIEVIQGENEVFGKTAYVICGDVKLSFDPQRIEE